MIFFNSATQTKNLFIINFFAIMNIPTFNRVLSFIGLKSPNPNLEDQYSKISDDAAFHSYSVKSSSPKLANNPQ